MKKEEKIMETKEIDIVKIIDDQKVTQVVEVVQDVVQKISEVTNMEEENNSNGISNVEEVEEGDDSLTVEVRQITLRMAKMWETKGHTHESMDLYRKIIKRYKDSPEAKVAKNSLVRYAKLFESQGRYHLAQSLYDELFL